MRQLMIVPALALLLAGCGGRAPEAERNDVTAVNSDAEANATGNEAAAGNALETVLNLNDRQRNAVFYRALEDAGITCSGVDTSERMPDQDGKPVWRANCRGISGSSHLISITPDGTANIITRTDR